MLPRPPMLNRASLLCQFGDPLDDPLPMPEQLHPGDGGRMAGDGESSNSELRAGIVRANKRSTGARSTRGRNRSILDESSLSIGNSSRTEARQIDARAHCRRYYTPQITRIDRQEPNRRLSPLVKTPFFSLSLSVPCSGPASPDSPFTLPRLSCPF